MTGQVHNYFFTFGKDGKPNYKFDGETMIKGETDGSSYPNGGLRATHTAGGYTSEEKIFGIASSDGIFQSH